MLKRIILTTVALGFAWTVCEGTEIWLNELKITGTGTDTWSFEVELVGRPLMEDPSGKPADLTATVQFYADGSKIEDGIVEVTLEADTDDWGGNYFGVKNCASACFGAGADNILSGAVVSYYWGSKVYCWGTGAEEDARINAGDTDDAEVLCEVPIVADAYTPPDENAYVDYALYGETDGEWEWEESETVDTDGAPFNTLTKPNSCDEADKTGTCDDQEQEIADYTYAPPANANDDEVWLNELDITVTGSTVTAKVEVVGGLVKVADEEAPDSLAVEVTFYSATDPVGVAVPVTLEVTEDADWNKHYVGEEDVTSDYALAFPADALGGLQLKWTSGTVKTAVYCWGPTAKVDDPIGTTPGLPCKYVVKTGGGIREDAANSRSNRALFSYSETDADGGTRAGHFYWTSSLQGGVIFDTIGDVNACEEDGECDPLVDQRLAENSWFPPSTGSTEAGMWLNELKVTDAGGEKSLEVELVGQPLTMDYPTVPVKLEAKLQFYNGDANAGDEVVAELITRSTSDDAKLGGNYLGRYECAAGSECAAASSAELGGVKVTYGGVSKVYCWGDGAADEENIGPAALTQAKCSTEYLVGGYDEAPGTDSFVDIALYDTDTDSGKEEQDWTWKVSENTAGTPEPFDTLGKVNVCADSTQQVSDCGTELVQTIAAYDYTEPPANTANTDEVWLNELDITVSSTNGVTAKLEIVGGVTSDTEVEVKFYLGDEEVKSESDQWKPVELEESSKAEWNSHYVGTVDVPADLGTAFPSDGALAGLQLEWGGKTSVYCWGSTAAIDETLGEEGVECKTVVKTGGPIRGSGDGSYNRALFNWSETPANGGTSAGHFYWTDSKNGETAFDSIGDVNVCEDDGDCIPTDQKLGLNGEEEVEEPPDEEKEEETPSSGLSLFICSWRLHAAVVIGLMTVMQFIR